MHQIEVWTQSAEAMELIMEGNRLIATEIARGVQTFWRRAVGSLDGLLQGLGKHGHLPPV